MSVEESALHPELDVAQLGVVHKLRVDPGRGGLGVFGVLGENDLVHRLLAVAGGENVR